MFLQIFSYFLTKPQKSGLTFNLRAGKNLAENEYYFDNINLSNTLPYKVMAKYVMNCNKHRHEGA
jgi:hypothetical protein